MTEDDARSGRSSGEVVAAALREEILSGVLPGGQRLIEESLASRFGVSRVPVREAIAQLESEGFVETVRYRGATVSEAPRQDGLELLQVRRGLEVLAAQLAAENRGGSVAGELSDIAAVEGNSTQPPSVAFHPLVAEASGNRRLIAMLSDIDQRVAWALGNDQHAATTDHAVIARAIVAGSTVQAAYLMDEHLRRDEEGLRRALGG